MAEPDYREGDRVRLLKLSDEFLSGLPKEDVEELVSLVGREWTVDEWHDDIQQVELTFWIREAPKRARCHSIWVPPAWIERIN